MRPDQRHSAKPRGISVNPKRAFRIARKRAATQGQRRKLLLFRGLTADSLLTRLIWIYLMPLFGPISCLNFKADMRHERTLLQPWLRAPAPGLNLMEHPHGRQTSRQ